MTNVEIHILKHRRHLSETPYNNSLNFIVAYETLGRFLKQSPWNFILFYVNAFDQME